MRLITCFAAFTLSFCALHGVERPATVLLITHDELAPAWSTFAAWKTAQGKSTVILPLSNIEARYPGTDTQDKIRHAVRDHINQHGTRWVILGGDSGGDVAIPDRNTSHIHASLKYEDVPTDVYYLSEANWDANGDGIYGDWNADNEAITWTDPTASIGRIPVRTSEQVQAYTNKVISYESAYPAENFALNFVQTCPEPHAYRNLITSARQLKQNWPDLQPLPYYAHRSAWDKQAAGDHDLNPKGFLGLINSQTQGKMHVHGHGLLKLWVLENQQPLKVEHLQHLTNQRAYPLITTVSCHTGRFDDIDDPSVAEAMVRLDKAGAIAVIAPSREGVAVFKDPADMQRMVQQGLMDGTTRLMTDFWDLGLNKNLSIGEAISAAKQLQIDEQDSFQGMHWLMSGVNVLGDPTLPVRNANPLTPSINVPENIQIGQATELSLNTGVPYASGRKALCTKSSLLTNRVWRQPRSPLVKPGTSRSPSAARW